MLNLSHRETISQIQENMFMQYFLGYSSFTNEPPFDASLFVDIRERLNLVITTAISEIIVAHHFDKIDKQSAVTKSENSNTNDTPNKGVTENESAENC
jgi:IS5 family transposase